MERLVRVGVALRAQAMRLAGGVRITEIAEVIGMSKESTKKLLSSAEGAQAKFDIIEAGCQLLGQRAIAQLVRDLDSGDDERSFRAAVAVLRMLGRWHLDLTRSIAVAVRAASEAESRRCERVREEKEQGAPGAMDFEFVDPNEVRNTPDGTEG